MKKKKYLIIIMSMMFLSACSIKHVEDTVSRNDGNVSSTVTGNEAGTFDTSVVSGMDDKEGMEEGEAAPESQVSDLSLVVIDETNFPDPVFRKYVSDQFDGNKDGKLNSDECNGADGICCDRSGKYGKKHEGNHDDVYFEDLRSFDFEEDTPDWDVGDEDDLEKDTEEEKIEEIDAIKSLQGIEFFPNLKHLRMRNHCLTSLDVRKNPELETLDLAGNQISELDLSANRKLYHLNCEGNRLVNLDVSAKGDLIAVICNDNALENIDISGDIRLVALDVSRNPITKLDISTCTQLLSTVQEGDTGLADKGKSEYYWLNGNEIKTDFEDTLITGKLRDVDKNAWYADAVYFVSNKFYMNSFTENSFDLEKPMNRAQFITALYNIAGCPKIEYVHPFKDVSKDVWYARPAVWASQSKITSGVSEDLFGGDQELTHEQLLSILYKYASKAGLFDMSRKEDALEVYSDKAQTDTWAVEAMQWAVGKGIWTGKQGEEGECLDPKGVTTRVECAQILRNLFLNTVEPNKLWVMKEYAVSRNRACQAEEVAEPAVDKGALAEKNLPEGAILINKTNFPDITFRQYLIEQFDEDDNGILEKEVLEGVDSIDLSYLYDDYWYYDQVQTLQGIEYFPNLAYLNCYEGHLQELDLSKNTKLQELVCDANMLTELDLTQNGELASLSCSRNSLGNLNVSKNTKLLTLNCCANKLTELDIRNSTELTNLDCSENLLKSLNTDKNTKLEEIKCFDNELTELNVSSATNLQILYCYGNPLKTLNIEKNTELRELLCYDGQLTELNVSNNTRLADLHCEDNQLKSLNLSSNEFLGNLRVEGNPLNRLDIRSNEVLCRVLTEGIFCQGDHGTECVHYFSNNGGYFCLYSDWDDLIITGAYKDVTSGASYEDAVYFVTNKHFMDGTGEELFEPDKGMNRLQAVKTLYKVAGSPDVKDVGTYEGISEEDSVPVTWALNENIASMISEDNFGSDNEVPHEQFITMLYKYASTNNYIPDKGKAGLLDAYSDKDQISDWAQEAMQWAVANDIVNSSVMESDNSLDPKGITTRKECAQVLKNYFNKIAANGKIKYMIKKYTY